MSESERSPAGSGDVAYPSIYALRMNQLAHGMDISRLNPVQKGIENVQNLHHISKSIGQDAASSYRVRICKSCSGSSKLLELGSYSDVESALLVNDGYELLQGRTQKLHVLVREDANFLHTLEVRRHVRGKVEPVSLLDVLQEKIIRTKSKRTISMTMTTPSGEVIDSADTELGLVEKRPREEGTEDMSNSIISPMSGSLALNQSLKLQSMLLTMKQNGRTLIAMYLWFGMAPNVAAVENSFNALSKLLKTQCADSRTHFEPDDEMMSRDSIHTLTQSISLPASNIYNLIGCYTPGEPPEICSLISRVKPLLVLPSLSGQAEFKAHRQAMNSIMETNRNPNSPENWQQLLVDIVHYAKMTLQGYLWIGYSIKMPLWGEGAQTDMFLVETNLQGMFGAVHVRVERSLALLAELSTLTRNAGSTLSSGSVRQLAGNFRRANLLISRSTVYGLLELGTAAMTVARVCEDFSAVETCLELYKKVWPQVDTQSCPLLLLQFLTHRYLELIVLGLARLDLSHWQSGIDEKINLAVSLHRDLIKLGRLSGILDKRTNEIPYGPGFMVFHEAAIRAYATLLALAAALGNASFFAAEGYSLRTCVEMTHHTVIALHEWTLRSKCSLYYAHTYLSLQSLVQSCARLAVLFPEYSRSLLNTQHLALDALTINAKRFGLARILVQTATPGSESDASAQTQAHPAFVAALAQLASMQWGMENTDGLITLNLPGQINADTGNMDELSGFRNPCVMPHAHTQQSVPPTGGASGPTPDQMQMFMMHVPQPMPPTPLPVHMHVGAYTHRHMPFAMGFPMQPHVVHVGGMGEYNPSPNHGPMGRFPIMEGPPFSQMQSPHTHAYMDSHTHGHARSNDGMYMNTGFEDLGQDMRSQGHAGGPQVPYVYMHAPPDSSLDYHRNAMQGDGAHQAEVLHTNHMHIPFSAGMQILPT